MQHNSEEIWKDIQNFNNKYQVSSYGRVKSLKDSWGNYKEKILKPDEKREIIREGDVSYGICRECLNEQIRIIEEMPVLR